MNRVLYLLVAGCFAGVAALAFLQKSDIWKMGSKDILAVIGFGLLLATGGYILIHSRRGRAWRQRFDQRTIDAEDQARTEMRNKGKVRPPSSNC